MRGTAHAMGKAAPAWHTVVTTMWVFLDASFPKKRRQPAMLEPGENRHFAPGRNRQ